MAGLGSVRVFIGVNTKTFEKGLNRAIGKFNKFGRTMKSMGSTISKNVTMPLVAIGVAGAKSALEFEESMRKVHTLVGVSKDEVSKMKTEVLALAGATTKAPKELADALFTITSAGLRGADAMSALEMAAKASAVGLGETQDIGKALTGVMQSYSSTGMTAAKATDVLTAIVREGNLEASSLAPVLGRVTGIAAQMGVSFEEVGASIATYTRLGLSAEEATTGLRAILNSMLSPTADQAEALKEVGLSADGLRDMVGTNGLQATLSTLMEKFHGNAAAISRVFPNVRGLSAVLGTAGAQGQQYAQVLDNIQNSTGILDSAFTDVSQGSLFKFNQAFGKLKKLGKQIGEAMLPTFMRIMDEVKRLVEKFNGLDQATKDNIMRGALLVAALGPVLSVLGSMITTTAGLIKNMISLSTALGKNIIGPIVRFTGAAWKMFYAALANTKVFKRFIGVKWATLVKSFRAMSKGMWSFVRAIAVVAAKVLAVIAIIGLLAGAAYYVYRNWEAFKKKFGNIWVNIQIMAQKAVSGISGLLKKFFNNIGIDAFNDKLDEAADGAAEKISELEEELSDDVEFMGLKESFQPLIDGATGAIGKIKEKIKSFTGDVEEEFEGIDVSGGESDDEKARAIVPVPKIKRNFQLATAAVSTSFVEPTKKKLRMLYWEWKALHADTIDNIKTGLEEFVEVAQQVVSSVSGLFNALNNRDQVIFDQMAERRQQEHDDKYDKMIEDVENSRMTEQMKSDAISQINADRATAQKTIDEDLDAKKRALARKQAKREKMVAIMSAIVNTASAVAQALPNIPLAAGVGILGAAQVAAIAATPLPALAQGGLAFGETAALVGDNPNASVDPEVIAPLSKLKSMMGTSAQQVIVSGVIRGEDLYLIHEKQLTINGRTE